MIGVITDGRKTTSGINKNCTRSKMIDDKFTMSAVLHCIIDQEVVQSFSIKPYREKN